MKRVDDFLINRFVSGSATRALRLKNEVFQINKQYDSEEEEDLSHEMFFQDLRDLKRIMADSLMEC